MYALHTYAGSGWPDMEDMLLEENVWTLIDEMSAKATLCSVSSKLPLSQFMLSQEQLDQIPSEADKIKRLRSKITSLDYSLTALQRMNSGGACGSTIEPQARQCPNQPRASAELHVDAGGSAGSAETSGACPA